MRVLIVEDNANDRRLLKLNVERHGCRVLEAVDGRQALEILAEQKPDLIISDALMPRLDGFELLREVKRDERLAAIPFVFYSAVYTSRDEEELAMAMGADAFVVKPLEPTEFWQRLQEVLERCRLRKEKPAAAPCACVEGEEYLRRYGRIVAAKLEEKVRELEGELDRRRRLEEEREQLIGELRQARDEWARTFDAMPEIITLLDREFRVVRCNQATSRLANKPAEEIIGKRCHEVLWGLPTRCQGCPTIKTLHDLSVQQHDIRIEEQGKVFQVTTTPMFDAAGRVDAVIHVARDVTEEKKLEERLRQAQKMEAIGTLAGGIAHDFNNILTALLGYAELIKQDLTAGSQSASDLDQVISASKRATDLVRQILTFSRRTEQKQQPLEIQHIAKEALKLLRPSLPSTIEIHQDIDPRCPSIMADPSQMHQVIMNLCANSYQAMASQGGILSLSLARHSLSGADAVLLPGAMAGEYVMLAVSDTGCGMDRKTRDKIFEPYFTTKAESGGTGLGLAVVHGIVKDHGGHISVYSEPGQGTTFKVYFPVPRKVPVGSAPTAPAGEIPTGHNEHLLYVDDEQAIVDLGRRWLEKLGYRVTPAVGADEALTIYLAAPADFDLVITDLSMPRMSGIELAQEILARRPEMPIILCTGFGDPAKMREAEAHGIRRYLTKPASREELARAVREILDSPPLSG